MLIDVNWNITNPVVRLWLTWNLLHTFRCVGIHHLLWNTRHLTLLHINHCVQCIDADQFITCFIDNAVQTLRKEWVKLLSQCFQGHLFTNLRTALNINDVLQNNPTNTVCAYILLSFVPILILFVLCVGVGMILCTMEVFFKDVEYMYEVFCMLLFYATPIFYNVETLHITNRYAQYALMANPLYSIVSMFRDCVLFGRAMNPNHIIYSTVFSIAMLLIGVLVFYKKQDDFILHI